MRFWVANVRFRYSKTLAMLIALYYFLCNNPSVVRGALALPKLNPERIGMLSCVTRVAVLTNLWY